MEDLEHPPREVEQAGRSPKRIGVCSVSRFPSLSK
jgi:hypothetical protein